MKLAGKTAIVTGAGSGIGKASALAFAKAGANVVCADIDEKKAKETAVSIEEQGGTAVAHFLDVTSYESVKTTVDFAIQSFGALNIMFNNAGIGTDGLPLLQTSVEAYRKTVGVNQDGVFFGIKAAAEVMKEVGGVIINTASIYAFIADRNQFAYHASKGAVVSMTKAAALELAKYGIRVVAIAPGLVETGIVSEWKKDPDTWAKIEKAQMRRKAGQPEDIANLALFLASDDAAFLNAHVYYADDGASAFKR